MPVFGYNQTMPDRLPDAVLQWDTLHDFYATDKQLIDSGVAYTCSVGFAFGPEDSEEISKYYAGHFLDYDWRHPRSSNGKVRDVASDPDNFRGEKFINFAKRCFGSKTEILLRGCHVCTPLNIAPRSRMYEVLSQQLSDRERESVEALLERREEAEGQKRYRQLLEFIRLYRRSILLETRKLYERRLKDLRLFSRSDVQWGKAEDKFGWLTSI